MSAPKLKAIKPVAKTQEIVMQDASFDIWDKKYRLKYKDSNPIDADIDATYRRVAKALSDVEEVAKRELWEKKFVLGLFWGGWEKLKKRDNYEESLGGFFFKV